MTEERDATEPGAAPSWCLVGNVVAEHKLRGADEVRQGSKHFTAGTKVYCLPPQWGDGFQQVVAIGMARKTRRWITVVMSSGLITNWRAQAVYSATVLGRLRAGFGEHAGQWESEAEVRSFANSLLARSGT